MATFHGADFGPFANSPTQRKTPSSPMRQTVSGVIACAESEPRQLGAMTFAVTSVKSSDYFPRRQEKADFKRDNAAGAPGTVGLTLQPAAGGEARELMRLADQQRSLMEISWSADSTKIAYVRDQPAPAAK